MMVEYGQVSFILSSFIPHPFLLLAHFLHKAGSGSGCLSRSTMKGTRLGALLDVAAEPGGTSAASKDSIPAALATDEYR